jgi:hypothetical protein
MTVKQFLRMTELEKSISKWEVNVEEVGADDQAVYPLKYYYGTLYISDLLIDKYGDSTIMTMKTEADGNELETTLYIMKED